MGKRLHEDSTNPFTNRAYSNKYYELLEKRKTLPCWAVKDEFLKRMEENQVLVLVGETGSGKTTQMPQFLAEHGYTAKGRIGVTQPRRVAAMSVAARVAEEMDVELGDTVGYSIRFEDVTSESTCVKYMTDGMLLRECMSDPKMTPYSVLVLDEAHERTLSTDILFGLIKRVLESRPDLKLLVMSATLEEQKFLTYFNAPLMSVSGRMYPVDVFFALKPTKDYVQEAINTVVNIHRNEGPGDVLVFLTGEEEIENACAAIREELDGEPITCLPLYSSLSPADQRKIFLPTSNRKVVIATNVAETSITIDGVVFVVDPGFSKEKVYNARTNADTLLVSPISRASAKQRCGRAGRTQPGKCFRLYTQKGFHELLQLSYPEIIRTNLSSVLLTLFKLGIEDVVHFDFMDPPSPEAMMRALHELHLLGAVDDECMMTPLGKQMAELPLDPQLSKILLRGVELGVGKEMSGIVALLSGQAVFMRSAGAKKADRAHSEFSSNDGDHLSLLNVLEAYEENGCNSKWLWEHYVRERPLRSALSVRRQLNGILEKMNLSPGESTHRSHGIRRALISGFFQHVAHLESGGKHYVTVREQQCVHVHPSSFLKHKPEWILYHELVLTERNYVRTCTSIRPEWMLEEAGQFFPQYSTNAHALASLEKTISKMKK